MRIYAAFAHEAAEIDILLHLFTSAAFLPRFVVLLELACAHVLGCVMMQQLSIIYDSVSTCMDKN